jgi:hypothetical protein
LNPRLVLKRSNRNLSFRGPIAYIWDLRREHISVDILTHFTTPGASIIDDYCMLSLIHIWWLSPLGSDIWKRCLLSSLQQVTERTEVKCSLRICPFFSTSQSQWLAARIGPTGRALNHSIVESSSTALFTEIQDLMQLIWWGLYNILEIAIFAKAPWPEVCIHGMYSDQLLPLAPRLWYLS